MPLLFVALSIAGLIWAVPLMAASAPGEPILSHSALDELENQIGLLGLLGLLGFFGLRGRDRRR